MRFMNYLLKKNLIEKAKGNMMKTGYKKLQQKINNVDDDKTALYRSIQKTSSRNTDFCRMNIDKYVRCDGQNIIKKTFF